MNVSIDKSSITFWINTVVKLNRQIDQLKSEFGIKFNIYDADTNNLESRGMFYWKEFHENGDRFNEEKSKQYFIDGFVYSILYKHIKDDPKIFNIIFNPIILDEYAVKDTPSKYLDIFHIYLKKHFPRLLIFGAMYTRLKIAMEKINQNGFLEQFLYMDTMASLFAQILTSLINFYIILWIDDTRIMIKDIPRLSRLARNIDKYPGLFEVVYYDEKLKENVNAIIEYGITEANIYFKEYTNKFNINVPYIG